MRIGVLAVQGAFAEHIAALKRLGADAFEIRQLADISQDFDGLVLPGGESTVMNKLLHDLGLYAPLKAKIEAGLPVLGTCAGMILLAKNVEGGLPCFGTLDMTVKRNAYGRQLGSFYTEESFGSIDKVPMTFIRAPYIKDVSDSVVILATVNSKIVAARQGNQLVTAFHPELNDDLTVHRYFIKICGGEQLNRIID